MRKITTFNIDLHNQLTDFLRACRGEPAQAVSQAVAQPMPCNCLAQLAVILVAQDTHYQTTFPYKHEPSQQSKAKHGNVADWINHQGGSL